MPKYLPVPHAASSTRPSDGSIEQNRSTNPPRSALACEMKTTGEVVGDVVIQWVSREHALGEIGFIVHPDHQGHGYATEMTRPLLRIAFEDVGLHRLIGRAAARHTASARVMEKLGMRRAA